MRNLIGLFGSSGSGKTTECLKAFKMFAEAGKCCYGFYCPAVFEHEEKIAIQTTLIPGGESRLLGSLCTQLSQNIFGKWELFPETLKWAENHLKAFNRCDLLIIDEIGPLEIVEGKGWVGALEVLRKGNYITGLVTYRPSLTEYFSENYPDILQINIEELDGKRYFDQILYEIIGE